MTLKVLALVLWIIVGISNLLQDKISKRSYALCWLCLLVYIIGGFFQ